MLRLAGDAASSSPLRFGPDQVPDDITVAALDALRLVRSRITAHPQTGSTRAPLEVHRLRDAKDVTSFIEQAWDATAGLLRGSRENMSFDRVGELVALLSRLRDLEMMIAAHHRSVTDDLQEQTGHALIRLSRCTTTDELVQSIPQQATQLGFDRVLFSTVSSGTWQPRSVHCRGGSEWARMKTGDRPTTRFTLPSAAANRHLAQVDEATMLARQQRESGFALWQRSKSKDFWMLPIVHQHRVIAMIHADCQLQERIPSKPEMGALQRYCDQLAIVLAHRFGHDASRTLQPGVVAKSSTPARATQVDDNTVAAELDGSLSEREIDVVRLMAEGMTNCQIGRRLTITEGTVKSHVKRILRKTASANRAEAVAIWMNSSRLTAV